MADSASRPPNPRKYTHALSAFPGARFLRSMSDKFTRYTGTYLWLLRCNLAVGGWATALVFGSGVVARLGGLVAFVTSIKCAVWLLAIDRVPTILQGPFHHLQEWSILTPALILLPTSMLMLTALARYINATAITSLKAKVAHSIATHSTTHLAHSMKQQEIKDQKSAQKILKEYEKKFASIYRAEGQFITILIMSIVIILAVLVGILVDPILIGFVVFMNVLIAILFISFRHRGSATVNKNQEEDESVKKEVGDKFVEKIDEWLDSSNSKESLGSPINYLNKAVSPKHQNKEKFASSSASMIGVGQAIIIMFFLIFISANAEIYSQRLTELVILVLLLRFIIGTMQTISWSAVTLSRDYALLVQVRQLFRK